MSVVIVPCRCFLVSPIIIVWMLSTRLTLAFSIAKSGRGAAAGLLWWSRQHPSSRHQPFIFEFSRVVTAASKRSTIATVAVDITEEESPLLTVAKEAASSSPASTSSSRPFRLVIVESPAKCKTISKILNEIAQHERLPYDFVVTACMGHVRNLSKRRIFTTTASADNGEGYKEVKSPIVGVNVFDQYTPDYVLLPEKEDVVRTLQPLAEEAEQIILATDDDREGEAIAWHLCQILLQPPDATRTKKKQKQKKVEEKTKILQRVTFTEITPDAIRKAFSKVVASSTEEQGQQHAWDDLSSVLNMNLVEAQETRRILDRLAGFTMSPLLWKKIAPGLSAGRVQSVGLALVVQRERQRLRHCDTDYSTLHGTFGPTRSHDKQLEASLIKVNGQAVARKSSDFESTTGSVLANKLHVTAELVQNLIATLDDPLGNTEATWRVLSVTSSPRTISPPVPFKTSTLQQEAYGKLGLPVAQTMRLAQNLYEAGKISYMRTDSIHLSAEAHDAVEKTIQTQYSPSALGEKSSPSPKKNSKKKVDQTSKFAQEAHEAIRPAIQPNGLFLTPEDIDTSSLPSSAMDLYRLIYQRTVASRMTPQRLNLTTIVIEGTTTTNTHHMDGGTFSDGRVVVEFRWSGSVVLDPGFTRVYDTLQSDDEKPNGSLSLASSSVPALVEGQVLHCHELIPESHVTQPPQRYTEASLVKELEALGVGRPSTYASIVQILRDRAYVGSLQSSSSNSFAKRGPTKPPKAGSILARRAAGGDDSLSFAGNRRGPLVPSLTAFVVCSLLERYCPTYVDPTFTASMEERLDWIATGQNNQDRVKYLDEFYAGDQGLAAQVQRIDETVPASEARRALLPGLLPAEIDAEAKDSEAQVGLFVGPWGPYVQKVTANDESSTSKPPTAPLPASMASDLSTLTQHALKTLLSTREKGGIVLGQHPDDGRNIRLKVGRFGPYLQWGDDGEESTTTHSLPSDIGSIQIHESIDEEIEDYPDPDGDTEGVTFGGGMPGITFEDAVGYVSLPRTVDIFNGLPITASLGPLGPYLKYNNTYVSLTPKDGNVLTVDGETAQRLILEGAARAKSKKIDQGVVSNLGEMEGANVTVKNGRFGMYINWKKINAKLPKEYEANPSGLSIEEAWELIQKKSSTTSKPKKESSTKKSSTKTKRSSSNLKAKAAAKKSAALDGTPGAKRPKSAYLYFCQAKRPEISKSVTSFGEVSKELGRLWKGISSDERKVYEEMARAGKAEKSAGEPSVTQE